MSPDVPESLLPPGVSRITGWIILFIVTVIATFNFPLMPAADLDPSWRMALGYFYEHGMQFGRDVVFNYGPLGFVMGKTYSGVQWWALIFGQLTVAVVTAAVVVLQAKRLRGRSRLIFLLFFLLLAISYEDALHMLIIAILGFELLRRSGMPWRNSTLLIAIVLSVSSQLKFTNFLLASFVVLLACAYSAYSRRWRQAGILALAYGLAYLAGWIALGQNVANLPAYFYGSWFISDGWLWSMGFPAPLPSLWKGLVILFLLIGYSAVHVRLHTDKPRAIANTLLLGAFIYLNWKHGFVRADGHMIGFFYCALLPLTAYPALLDDPPCGRRQHYWIFLGAILLSLWALENSLWGVLRNALGQFQGKVWSNIEQVVEWKQTRQNYRDHLNVARADADLYMTRDIAGKSTIDVVGFEIGAAVLNRLNYQPRPVIQSYSTFNPPLERLNYDLYASDRAPQYVLSKIETIDGRLPTMDDARVLLLLAYRYQYIRTEKGFGLWHLTPGPFDPVKYEPTLLRSETLPVNEPLKIAALSNQALWLKVDLQPSFLGKLRSFFYKPPQVVLHIETEQDLKRDFLMPLPQGRTGFVLNPLIEDVVDYMHFANSEPVKKVRSITINIPEDQLKFFAPTASIELSSIPFPTSGKKFFASEIERLLHMFQSFPVSYTSLTPVSETIIDGREAAVLHAPSQMIFDLPKNPKLVSGKFGMMPGTYTNGGNTDGALFIVYWSNGTDRVELFQRYLDPMKNKSDRGLQDFSGSLKGLVGGRLFLEIQNGPNNNKSWDWTAWSNIKIE
ncbi:MAG TPA: hypothetical protein VGM64_18310 [Lacunisphaera sp.]|jgi:hypothetical protein